MCRLLSVAKSQMEAETSQNYFMPFFFPLLASLLRLSTSGLWQVRMAAAAAGASVPLHCVGCAMAGDKDVPSTKRSSQDASGGEGNK